MFTSIQKIRLLVVLVGSLLITPSPAYALKEYYGISRSVRALGMGGAFYGLSDDEMAMFYNPAGLGFYEGGKDLMAAMRFDGSFSIVNALQAVTSGGTDLGSLVTSLEGFQGQPIYGGASPLFGYYLRKYFTAGILLADTKLSMAVLGRDLDTDIDVTAISDSGLFVGFAVPIGELISVGMNVKGVFRAGGRKVYSVLDIAQGQGFDLDIASLGGMGGGVDMDLGATVQLPDFIPRVKLRGSLVLNNLLASKLDLITIQNYAAPPALPRTLTLGGVAQLPGFWWFERFNLLLDLAEFGIGGQADPDFGARSGSFWKHVNLGVEVPVWGWAFGRMGFHQGNFTIGAGIDARFFQLDIATYAEELAYLPGRLTSRRVALRLAAGFGGRAPGAVESATETKVPDPTKPADTTQNGAPAKPGAPTDPKASTKPGADGAKTLPKAGKPRGDVDRFNVDKAVKESY